MSLSELVAFDSEDLYVLDMTEHAGLDESGEALVDFGTPVVAAISTLLTATAVVPGSVINLGVSNGFGRQGIPVDGAFGRILQITSTAVGVVIVTGRDYLNQVITQSVTCVVGNVNTLKAFKRITRINSTSVTGNVSIGPGARLGMPLTCNEIIAEYLDGVAATEGTLTALVATSPATNLTGDPRGTYAYASTLNGIARLELRASFTNRSAGGLYGVPQV
jgi:hypothetical protein